MTTVTLAWATAGAVSVVARSRPFLVAEAIAFARPGSAIGHPPLFTAATSASSTSQPITEAPFRANWAARGRPILPRPITAIVRSLAFISNLLGTHGEAGSAGLGEGVGDRDGGKGIVAADGHGAARGDGLHES